MSEEEAAFLTTLKTNPADDIARLVYADWLDEHNEPTKAEYLRLVAVLAQCEQDLSSTAEAPRLLELAPTLPEEWRTGVGSRFDLILNGYTDKIQAIKWIRESTGDSLGESKAASEALPHTVHACIPFELASALHNSKHRPRVIETRIMPSGFVPPSSNSLYTLAVYCSFNLLSGSSQAEIRERQQAERAAREALVSLIVAARGATIEETEAAVAIGQQIVLATDLTIREARLLRSKLSPLIPTYSQNRNWWFWVSRFETQPQSTDSQS